MPVWAPWDFSAPEYLATALTLLWFVHGLALAPPGERPPVVRRVAFVLGVVATYAVLQTRFEYWSQHMFFLNRIQHVVMHHLGPVPDRARLRRVDDPAGHAGPGAEGGRQPRGRRHAADPAAACAGGLAVRRAVLLLADPGGAFPGDARPAALRPDELEHGPGWHPVLVAGAGPAAAAAGARVLRRARGAGARRHVPADRARRADRVRRSATSIPTTICAAGCSPP